MRYFLSITRRKFITGTTAAVVLSPFAIDLFAAPHGKKISPRRHGLPAICRRISKEGKLLIQHLRINY